MTARPSPKRYPPHADLSLHQLHHFDVRYDYGIILLTTFIFQQTIRKKTMKRDTLYILVDEIFLLLYTHIIYTIVYNIS